MLPEYTSLNLLLIMALWLLLPILSSDNRFWRAAVLVPVIVIQLWYVHWRFTETLEVFEFSGAILWQYSFLATELVVITYSVWQCITLVRYTNRSDQCDRLLEKKCADQEPSIDLFLSLIHI